VNHRYVAPPTGINMTNRRVAVGFLLVFHIHCSSNSCRSQVIMGIQPSNIKPEVETALIWCHTAEPHYQSMGRFRFAISVPYIALVELLPFTGNNRFSAYQNQTGSGNQPYVTPPTK
jgi:hypothetical protein